MSSCSRSCSWYWCWCCFRGGMLEGLGPDELVYAWPPAATPSPAGLPCPGRRMEATTSAHARTTTQVRSSSERGSERGRGWGVGGRIGCDATAVRCIELRPRRRSEEAPTLAARMIADVLSSPLVLFPEDTDDPIAVEVPAPDPQRSARKAAVTGRRAAAPDRVPAHAAYLAARNKAAASGALSGIGRGVAAWDRLRPAPASACAFPAPDPASTGAGGNGSGSCS